MDTISIFDQGIPATSKGDPEDANPIKEFYRILEDVVSFQSHYIRFHSNFSIFLKMCSPWKSILENRTQVLRKHLFVVERNFSNFRVNLKYIYSNFSYKQVKFNMLREESEGFSKLVTELIDNDADLSANEICNRIFSLIGTFA